jgi:DNA uptake protein ComE-like DNA-binding protein
MRILHLLAVSIFAAASFVGAQPISAPQSQQTATHAQASDDLLDINTATPQQLKALPGFGDAYVRRVIAGRPYTAKNQLVTRGILSQSAYDAISSQIVARRPARQP